MSNIVMAAGGDDGYQISRSVRTRSSAAGYFSRTPASTTNRRTNTWSFWAKRGDLARLQWLFSNRQNTGSSNYLTDIYFTSSDTLIFQLYDAASSVVGQLTTTQLFRDPSAWYHIVCVLDTTQATASNRMKLYVNGVQVTTFSTATYPSLNFDTGANVSTYPSYLGNYVTASPASANNFDGYLTEINFIDGQALTPSNFGETDVLTGVWKPKKYLGTYGTNGFYLNFSDNSAATAAAIGKDSSGNGNNWTPNNISVTAGVTYDSMIDVPTMYADGGNGRGNYCVLNPISNNQYNSLTDGNLALLTSVNQYGGLNGSIGVNSGKWYWEITVGATGAPAEAMIGIRNQSASPTVFAGNDANGYSYYGVNGNKWNSTGSAYGATFTSGDVIAVAFDADNGTLTFYKNNASQGVAFSSIPMAGNFWFPALGDGSGTNQCLLTANFGQRPFAYTPPTGFKALNTQNLPDATIKKGNQYFDATTYTGNGTSLSVVNSGAFQPDLVWVKGRSVAYSNLLIDSVRGIYNRLVSDSTAAEVTDSTTLTAFNSNGFTFGSGIGGNQNAATYVGWQWKKGATQGFDIQTFTRSANGVTTFNHNLGVAPSMVIIKGKTVVTGWTVGHKSLGVTSGYLTLNTTSSFSSSANAIVTNTSTQCAIGTDYNTLNGDYVAYLFSEVAGFSKFGSYTGNGSTDGPFVYCGFRPRFVMVKRTDSAGGSWVMYDTARDAYNLSSSKLAANLSEAENGATVGGSTLGIDALANGFKHRNDGGGNHNASGGTYIYAAFAENPFKNSLAR